MIPSLWKQIAGGFTADGEPDDLFLTIGFCIAQCWLPDGHQKVTGVHPSCNFHCRARHRKCGSVCKLAAENRCWIGSPLRAIDIASSSLRNGFLMSAEHQRIRGKQGQERPGE
jgi:hypothetical protein